MWPKQQTRAASGFDRRRKRTRRKQFLADMSRVAQWGPLVELIAPVYPNGEGAGRPPVPDETTICKTIRLSPARCPPSSVQPEYISRRVNFCSICHEIDDRPMVAEGPG